MIEVLIAVVMTAGAMVTSQVLWNVYFRMMILNNTGNYGSRLECCWYSNELSFDPTGIFVSALNDFSELIQLCQNLPYAFEHNDVDKFGFIPRGTFKSDGSWFCSMSEDKILEERHYYQGYIDYEHDRRRVSFDWYDLLKKSKISQN